MRFVSFFLFVCILFFYSCKQQEEDLSQVVSEVEKKQTELKETGVPSFIIEEQKTLETNTKETNTNQISPPDTDEFFETKMTQTMKLSKVDETNVVEEKIESLPSISNYTKTYNEKDMVLSQEMVSAKKKQVYKSKVSGFSSKKTPSQLTAYKGSKKDVKVYFSYRNGKKYIDVNNPGKITTVVYVDENVWYVDYSVYAIPYKYLSNYRKYMVRRYLIGIGRNISVVDRRSQFTVYWSGINLDKKFLSNGKYMIVVKNQFKNRSKKIISSYTKMLGLKKPLIVILAN